MSLALLPLAVVALLDAAADRHSVNREIVRAVAWVESEGKHYTDQGGVRTSAKGAIGIMGIMPDTAKELGIDPRDEEQNIDGAARLLARLTKMLGENRGVAAYHAGAARIARGIPWPAATREYVRRVEARADLELSLLEDEPTQRVGHPLKAPQAAPGPDAVCRPAPLKKQNGGRQ